MDQCFSSTNMQDTDVHTDHIASCEQEYSYTAEGCPHTNDQSHYRHLLVYDKSNEPKAHYL